MKKTTPLKLVSLASVSLLIAACGTDSADDNGDAEVGEQLDYTITGI